MNVNSVNRARVFLLSGLMALLVLSVLSTETQATNGYFRHGYGTKNKGLAGAGVALPLNTMIAVTNPAGMVFIGRRYDIGFSLFNPNREYTVKGAPSGGQGTFGLIPSNVDSDAKPFFIPALGANWMLDENSSVGVSLFGNGGMNTTYPSGTFFGSTPTGVDLSQIFLGVTYARKINDKHAFGITPILAFQIFQVRGIEAFANFSRDPADITNKGKSTSPGFGLRFGYLGEWLPFLSVGAAFQTKIYMSKFDDYAGLFAEQGDFDVPLNWVAGVALKATPDLTFVFDVQQIMYSDINSVGNPMNPQNFQQGILLGDDNGSGFGWDDMTIVKFGVQWAGPGGWTWRGGYSFGDQPIPSSEVLFNILAPGVIEQHITFGFSKNVADGREVSLAIMYAPSKTVSGPNPLDPVAQQTIDLKMNQWEIDVSLGF
ncbi:MAG: OmpP1/FadL family transporter [bacterium]